MPELHLVADVEKQIAQLCQGGGAFLTVKHEERLNTMTIGWGTIGFIWGKLIIMVAVRPSRYTFDILEQSLEFTVSIPFDTSFKDALELCGTKSGRDMDKFEAAGLKPTIAQKIATPVISGAAWHYECNVVYRTEMTDAGILAAPIRERLYTMNSGGLHELYFGEILAGYLT